MWSSLFLWVLLFVVRLDKSEGVHQNFCSLLPFVTAAGKFMHSRAPWSMIRLRLN
jgi:hypothetical protein